MKKVKLPLKAAVKMGLRGVWAHPVRLVIVIFLTVCALVMLGLAVTVASYRSDVALAESYYQNESAIVLYDTDEDGEAKPITEGKRKEAESAIGHTLSPLAFGEALSGSIGSYAVESESSYDDNKAVPCYYNYTSVYEMKTFCNLSEEAVREEGFTLYGRLPQTKNEVAICSCWVKRYAISGFYDFVRYPYLENEQGIPIIQDRRGVYKITSADDLLKHNVQMYLNDPVSGERYAADLVGVVDYGTCYASTTGNYQPRGYYDSVFVSADYMQEYMTTNAGGGIGYALVAGMPCSRAESERIVSLSQTGGYRVESEIVLEFAEYDKNITGTKTAFFVIGVVFCVFAALLIYQFVSISVADKKGQIGILRALGAHSSDVYKVFFAESLFLVVIDCVLSVPLTYALCGVVNNVLRIFFGIPLAFMHFGAPAVLAIISIALVVTAATTFFPVYRLAQKPPVDSIRECL